MSFRYQNFFFFFKNSVFRYRNFDTDDHNCTEGWLDDLKWLVNLYYALFAT